jgi:predicted Zn-dependent peptidase
MKRMSTKVSEPLEIQPSQALDDRSDRWDYQCNRKILPGGLTLIQVAQPHLHSVSISAFVSAGSRFESPKDNGLVHFLEHMVFRGTRSFPTSFDLNLAVERIGGNLNAATTPDSTEYTMSVPSENVERGINLIAELLTRPRFNSIEVERKIILEEIREDLDQNGNPVDIDFLSRRRLWPDHPLGQCITGPVENAMRFDIGDLGRCFEKHYVSGNTVVCISGAIDPDRIGETVERAFHELYQGSRLGAPPTPRLSTHSSTLHVNKPGSQTQLRVAFHAPGATAPDSTASDVMLRMIDDGMSTPLHHRIFETRGLAYDVCASCEQYLDVGAINFDAASSHENVADILTEVLQIVSDLRDRPIVQADLDKARERAVWDLKDFQDSPSAMNGWYGELELLGKIETIEEQAEKISAITLEDIAAVARRIFIGSGLHVTTVGIQDDAQRNRVEMLARSFS